jgi:Spy/CpxP family protein refolding chaperone
MKKVGLATGLVFLLLFFSFTLAISQADAPKGCKGMQGMGQQEMMAQPKCGQSMGGMMQHMGCCKMSSGMGMGMGMMEGEKGMGCCEKEFLLCCKDDLGLTDKQIEALKDIKVGAMKSEIKMGADLKIAELELKSLMEDEKSTLKDIETKLRAVEKLKVDMKISHLKAFKEAKALLTPEQKEKMMKCHQGM